MTVLIASKKDAFLVCDLSWNFFSVMDALLAALQIVCS